MSIVLELYENERLILEALQQAHEAGRMEYAHFSPAWDVTAARCAALSWCLASDGSQWEVTWGTDTIRPAPSADSGDAQ